MKASDGERPQPKQSRIRGRKNEMRNLTMPPEYWGSLDVIGAALPGGLNRSATVRYLIDMELKRMERDRARQPAASKTPRGREAKT